MGTLEPGLNKPLPNAPTQPYPQPQEVGHARSEKRVVIKLKSPPAAIEAIRPPPASNTGICTGVDWSLEPPSPSWPTLSCPHAHKVPSALVASTCVHSW